MVNFSYFLILSLVAQVFIGCCPSYRTDLVFDSKQWKSGDRCARASMSRNLQEADVLKDKSMNEVEELLGPPDEVFTPNRWSYRANFASRCSVIWDCYSSIRFDDRTGKTNGRVLVSD